ncbi:Uncharacterized protein OBRU01_02372 [Operophtera brumata]|uniref:Uncharacterized protein n=1 Tax=Operophtera brumata TaxID=104452 RepID=A0A0L7LME4_OPEBR|nr:Uncharacterized protein OBRU01_02372 [Operophtera brumata]
MDTVQITKVLIAVIFCLHFGDSMVSEKPVCTMLYKDPSFEVAKLLQGGSYLVMIDCGVGGVASLSARRRPTTKGELMSVVSKLPMGKGKFTCLFT